MRLTDFNLLSDDQLRQLADDQLAKIDGCGPADHPAYLLTAQLYMNEIDRRHDTRVGRRDFWMEVTVIVLILAEVIFGIIEGNKQATILDRVSSSTKITADITKDVKASSLEQAAHLKTLADEQVRSLDSLKVTNDTLQASVKQTKDMAVATQEQLVILKQEQASRQAQLAKKPKLELYIGALPLDTFFKVSLKEREQTDTSVLFDFSLKNSGDAAATRGWLRVFVRAKDVTVQCNCQVMPTGEPPDSPERTFLIPFEVLRPNVRIPISITFTYPKGQKPFDVSFNVDADEISTATPLGSMTVRPREPLQ